MDGLHIVVVVLIGVVSCSHDQSSASVLEVTVRPGDNITLCCDCRKSTGVSVVWYRNCSHENQPSLVLKIPFGEHKTISEEYSLNPVPRFLFVSNDSSNSYDLLIMNITDSDEGLYYCGTEQKKVEAGDKITETYIHTYGNITTRITVNSSEHYHHKTQPDCSVCWSLLFCLCGVCAVLCSLLASLVVYCMHRNKAQEPQADQRLDTRGQTRLNEDEDVSYAALEIRQSSQRPKKKKTQSSDFSTYSAINTSRM